MNLRLACWTSHRCRTSWFGRAKTGNLGRVDDLPLPLNRWGRIARPAHASGAYLYAEVEPGEDWKKPPSEDVIRLWQRRPGVPDDHDDNWTVWLPTASLAEWVSEYEFAEWLPEDREPDWDRPS